MPGTRFRATATSLVSLEAVVLDDGLALGPDSTKAIPCLRAEGDGLKNLASDVLTAFNSGGKQAAVDLLSGIVAGPFPSALAASPRTTPMQRLLQTRAMCGRGLAEHG